MPIKNFSPLANHPQKCYNIFIIYHLLPYAAAKNEVLFMMLKEIAAEAERGEYTEFIYDTTCFGEPAEAESAEDIAAGIERAMALEARPVFLEGLAARLTELGTPCTAADVNIMLAEVKRRYKDLLGIPCPRTVLEWVRGTTPGVTNRRNNYDLCCALEMDLRQTEDFFQKHFLTIPFNIKSRTDAVFMYTLYHKLPYSAAVRLLESSQGFVPQENAHTATSQILSAIITTADEEQFLRYLSAHCYNNEQQFQLARRLIREEVDILHSRLIEYDYEQRLSEERLGSLTIETLLGYKYQTETRLDRRTLPRRFTESLPNDVTIGRILNGNTASYDLLRKTLILLKFYNFYYEADNSEPNEIAGNLLDFCDELDATLDSCGFSKLYVCHPFDCLLMYCANSNEPIDALYSVINSGRK